jgi:thiazole synthase
LIAQHLQDNADPLLDAFTWQRFHQVSPSSGQGQPLQITPLAKSMQILNHPPHSQPSPPVTTDPPSLNDPLTIAGRAFSSRLMTGSGKFDDFEVMRQSLAASGSQIVTVAVRRVQTNAPGHVGLAEALDWRHYWMLPNTAGCATAEEAIRVARLGREMAKLLGQEDNNFVKLEVIPDTKYLLPDPIGTLQAAEQLVKEGLRCCPTSMPIPCWPNG